MKRITSEKLFEIGINNWYLGLKRAVQTQKSSQR